MGKFNKTGCYEVDGVSNSFSFKTSLSAYEKIAFVNNVSGLVVGEDNYYSLAFYN